MTVNREVEVANSREVLRLDETSVKECHQDTSLDSAKPHIERFAALLEDDRWGSPGVFHVKHSPTVGVLLCRLHDDPAIWIVALTPGGDAFDFCKRHMDDSTVLGVHRIEFDLVAT